MVLEEYRQIIKGGIKQKELDRAKAQIKANLENLIIHWLKDNLDVSLIDIQYFDTNVKVIYKRNGLLEQKLLFL